MWLMYHVTGCVAKDCVAKDCVAKRGERFGAAGANLNKVFRVILAVSITPLLFFTLSLPVEAVDWTKVKSKSVYLFYTGQASWEWALSQNEHVGAQMLKEGRKCNACHLEQEETIGAKMLSGHTLEPKPLTGTPGHIEVSVKTARDDQRLYFQLQWQPPAINSKTKMDADFAAKVSLMFDDGSVTEAARAGCWASCHSDNTGMPHAGNKPLTKYLPRSRKSLAREGGGDNIKAKAELEQMLKDGIFMEYWEAKLNQNAPAAVVDGYVLERRHESTPAAAVAAQAAFENGRWTLVLSRALNVANSPGTKKIEPGKTYHFGIALHDNHSAGRYHYVSFEHTFVLDKGRADFVAAK